MPKEEWGTKRLCPKTGRRFYDLNRDPIVSPYTGEIVPNENGKATRTMVADKSAAQNPATSDAEDEEVILEDDDDESSDVDLGDEVLDDDDDDDNVSLDDIADMSSDEDDS